MKNLYCGTLSFFVYLRQYHTKLLIQLYSLTSAETTLIESIKSDSAGKRQAENQLYRRFVYLIREGAWKHRLSEDDTSMAYSDSILTVIENIESGRFESRATLKTYVYQIFTNKCVDLIRKQSTHKATVHHGASLTDFPVEIADETRNAVEHLMEQYEHTLLYQRIRQLGEKCREMIRLWSEGTSDQLIATELGYNSGDVVKTSRLRCLEKLRGMYKSSVSRSGF